MLFRRDTLEGIRRGDVSVAFRRWKRPTVKAGSRVRTAAGVVKIGDVTICNAGELTADDARRSGFVSLEALQEMLGTDDGNPVYRITLLGIEADERVGLREAAEPSGSEWHDIRARFERWEKTAPGFFPAILKLIGEKPAVLAADLAAMLGKEKLPFKADVRKLKELGLTESLDIGYRLSPRGERVLRWLEDGR